MAPASTGQHRLGTRDGLEIAPREPQSRTSVGLRARARRDSPSTCRRQVDASLPPGGLSPPAPPAAQFSRPGPGGPSAQTAQDPRLTEGVCPRVSPGDAACAPHSLTAESSGNSGCSLSPLAPGSLRRFLKGLTGCRKHPLPEVGGPPPRHAPPRPLLRPALGGGLLCGQRCLAGLGGPGAPDGQSAGPSPAQGPSWAQRPDGGMPARPGCDHGGPEGRELG